MKLMKTLLTCTGLLMTFGMAQAADMQVEMNQLTPEGTGDAIGWVTISESEYGLVFTPQLKSLPPGRHGFHIHENPSCEPAEKDGKMNPGGAAGGHYDPDNTGMHGTPFGEGHLGDLSALHVDEDGRALYPVLAPRLKKLEEIKGRALMVHSGGDNYSDTPEKLGGGGSRIACGVIKK
ncbi:MAG: superoxide dismutase [Cu-Zn] SodC [Desulfobulbaceae bacterium]|nr:superoxide dismutase [Cu-Zn] SodC [Desulfobulbaceae bacterium]